MDRWYLDNLVCPVDKQLLSLVDGKLISSSGREYPVVDGIPVMLVDNVEQTMPLVSASIERARNGSDAMDVRAENLYLESLGISEAEKRGVVELAGHADLSIDPVVSYIIGATSGYAYKDLIGKLKQYPIPELRLPQVNGRWLLDIGCNWGRWSVAAARKGYAVVGIDPSLGAVMAARRVATELELTNKYIVGDVRFLPFKDTLFDAVFSYSVLQHLSKENVGRSLGEIERVLNPDGKCLVQMPNFLGVRCLQHQLKRRFREAEEFEVRYWSIPELNGVFSNAIGQSHISVDCYFGLGLQKSDFKYMTPAVKGLIVMSEALRKLSVFLPFLKYLADSVYVHSEKAANPHISSRRTQD